MKKFILITTTLLFTLYANAQIVNIPDAIFKTYLLAYPQINTNGDGEIQVSEASAFTGTIDVMGMNSISDLTGIEFFTALTALHCSSNPLGTLDVSNNIALIELYCDDNQLSILNVKNGNNSNFTYFQAHNNPNLYCIEVDNASWSTVNWTEIDSQSSYSSDCSNWIGLFTGNDPNILCNDSILLNPNVIYSGTTPLFYTWSPSNGLSDTTIINPIANPTNTTTYTITVSNGIGNAIDSITVFVDPLAFNPITDVTIICGNSTTFNLSTNSLSSNITYQWSPIIGLDNPNIINPVANPSNSTTYTVTATLGNCVAIDSITVYLDPLPAQEICMVTVDSVYGKNKIIWEKALLPIEEYYIWKETFISGTYNLMDVVPYDSVGMYIDMTSEPNVQSDKYKISVLDSCGYISDMGNYHKTIHLNVSPAVPQGYALTWEHYEGFNFSTYVIYRKHNNNPFDSIQSIAYSPGVFTYTDLNAPGGNISYFIAARKPTPCDTTMIGTKLLGEPYSQSLSNIEDNIAVNVNEISIAQCKIFPNPTTGIINVEAENVIGIEVINIQGEKVISQKSNIKNQKCEIDLSSQPKGIYIIKITTNKGVAVEKVVLE